MYEYRTNRVPPFLRDPARFFTGVGGKLRMSGAPAPIRVRSCARARRREICEIPCQHPHQEISTSMSGRRTPWPAARCAQHPRGSRALFLRHPITHGFGGRAGRVGSTPRPLTFTTNRIEPAPVLPFCHQGIPCAAPGPRWETQLTFFSSSYISCTERFWFSFSGGWMRDRGDCGFFLTLQMLQPGTGSDCSRSVGLSLPRHSPRTLSEISSPSG
jgi:hypothetical protein